MKKNNMDEIDVKTADTEKLKKLRVDYHPDKYGGNFPDDITKKIYTQISDELILRADSNNGNELIKIQNDIISQQQKFMENIILAKTKTDYKTDIKEDFKDYIIEYRGKFKFPKISASAFAAAMSFVFFAPETLSSHPILGTFISQNPSLVLTLWGLSIIILLETFIFIFLMESKTTQIIDRIQSTVFIRNTFMDFLSCSDNKFSEDNFVEYFISKILSRFYKRSNVPYDLIVKICHAFLIEAEEKGLIEKINSKSFDLIYKPCIDQDDNHN